MADATNKARSLEQTPTWAVAVVCLVLVVISIIIEHAIHMLGKWFKKRHKTALYEALEKVKAELMLMGFISLLLTVTQSLISDICIPRNIANTWHPCDRQAEAHKYGQIFGRKLVEFSDDDDDDGTTYIPRRSLATSNYDKCQEKGKIALVSAYGIHQLHIFIFMLAVCHILYCIIIYALGRTKMRKWKSWENETKTIEYQYYNDPERFRFARDTSFGRRHLNCWSRSTLTLWIMCFFRQFFGSVTKVDYLTLRHGFIMAHLAPANETKFDFQKYIKRSLEDDFKVVVGISPIIWFIAVLFLLAYTHGWYSYLWLPFVPLIVILMVGTKLQVIITELGVSIQDRGGVVKGAPLVRPGDDLFWFGRPRFLLFLIHLVVFTNAFQLAFFVWSTYEFSIRSCYHEHLEDIIIRISMGVVTQFICSYVTLPLYALVTQMGSNMRPTIFNERVATALRNWHQQAKKHTKQNKQSHSQNTTPLSSRPATPTHGMSPVHLLHNYPRSVESYPTSPRLSITENNRLVLHSPRQHGIKDDVDDRSLHKEIAQVDTTFEESNSLQRAAMAQATRTQHEIDIASSIFSLEKK
ncbi:MLO-like protein 12 isoform X2 [Gossypium arboreum]|uniref:MLO-like protein 12 isoform X2 n=1 Tax=Gossypium arboreum TaxID=29729 RepID=UPI0022F162DC|nr:MLO-like protein 12 isoform X2 [Gossypium arboreum]